MHNVASSFGGAPLNIANGVREFARATPQTTAVIDGDRSLTYARARRAGQPARQRAA